MFCQPTQSTKGKLYSVHSLYHSHSLSNKRQDPLSNHHNAEFQCKKRRLQSRIWIKKYIYSLTRTWRLPIHARCTTKFPIRILAQQWRSFTQMENPLSRANLHKIHLQHKKKLSAFRLLADTSTALIERKWNNLSSVDPVVRLSRNGDVSTTMMTNYCGASTHYSNQPALRSFT